MEEKEGKDIYIKSGEQFIKINIPTNDYRVYRGDTLDAVKNANDSTFILKNIDSVFFKIKNGTYELLEIHDYDNVSEMVDGKKSRKIKSKRRPKKKRSQKKRKMSKKRGKK